jgi:sterol desaturase/sphingolipid hydroxylase (fatty acid hydroxylase superfamily)
MYAVMILSCVCYVFCPIPITIPLLSLTQPFIIFTTLTHTGTAADHHVHHKLFNYNYGHLFMYCDWLFGTYKDPSRVEFFNKGL